MRDRYYDREKKDTVVCLAGVRSLLRPEKKVLVVCLVGARSVWRVRDRYYHQKKNSSRLSGGCAIVIKTGKKSSSCLSGGCAITTISTTGPIYAKSSDFYAKLNVSNLNVTNLY